MEFDFKVGKTYRVTPKDERFPVLDHNGKYTGKDEVISSPSMTLRVLGHAKTPAGFIEVYNLEKNRTHLYFVSRTDTAIQCAQNMEQTTEH